MAELRELLGAAGYDDVATHLQSGNVVLTSRRRPATLERSVAELIADRFGFSVPVSARTAEQLAGVLAHDPIPDAAREPKRYQVTFLPASPPAAAVARLEGMIAARERLAVHGRELYSWHPDGIARSKLAAGLTASELGDSATVRNWVTVGALHALAAG